MNIPGNLRCRECNNEIPLWRVATKMMGSQHDVIIVPDTVICTNCGRTMDTDYEEARDGELPGLHGGDHLGGGAGRGEDPPGRSRTADAGRGPVQDHGLQRPAAVRASERVLPGDGAGGSPDDLPAAASHLAIGGSYLICEGPYVDHVGELAHVDATGFGTLYCTLDVHTKEGLLSRAARVRDSALQVVA